MKRFCSIAVLLALVAPAAATAQNVTLYDTIVPVANPAFVQVFWYNYSPFYWQQVGSSFSTGSFSGNLASVSVVMRSAPSGGRAGVFIYGDQGGLPNGLVGQLSWGSSTPYGSGDFNIVTWSASGLSLAPNTTYWVVLAEVGSQFGYYEPGDGGEVWWAEINDTPHPFNEVLKESSTGSWHNYNFHYIPQMRIVATAASLQPVASAGANATAHQGTVVTLDGSASSDPSGLALSYAWEFVSKPAGSSAALSDATAVGPVFTVDMAGEYIVRLVVTNSAGVASTPATVTISTWNTAPVADPGPNQAIIPIGAVVSLSGAGSYDVDGDALTYSWAFASTPAGSQATLTGATTVAPTFVADVQGTYTVRLVVSDPWVASAPAIVTISFSNIKPTANAGTGQLTKVGSLVTLDASGSSDPNLDPLSYHWSFTTIPANSGATLLNPNTVDPTFVPDQPGTYVVQLIVNDGLLNSDPSTVQVQVTAAGGSTLFALMNEELSLINALDYPAIKNSNLQTSLVNKLQAAVNAIESGDYHGAASGLQHDFMGKTDGCALAGAPDKNDWILTCAAQQDIYTTLGEIIKRIKDLEGR